MEKRNNDTISLEEWVYFHSTEDERRKAFLNMDRALKYIHEHGFCISVFYPSMIEVLNDRVDHIKFNELMPLPFDERERKNIINEDIFRSSLVQIGIYSNTLKYLTPEFLKDNFDSFIHFLPNGDIPYYRGIIQRGATVYFSDFANEKTNRDLADLESQLGGSSGNEASNNKSLTKSNGFRAGIEPITNDYINDNIYRQINGLKDSAFISYLIVPTIILISLVAIGLVYWCFSLI